MNKSGYVITIFAYIAGFSSCRNSDSQVHFLWMNGMNRMNSKGIPQYMNMICLRMNMCERVRGIRYMKLKKGIVSNGA